MKVLEGIRVLDVSQYAFVPAAGAVLADWGAEVIHVEHPSQGDAARGMTISGFGPAGTDTYPLLWEITGRGKRSVGIDLSSDRGHELLLRLAETADVFLTSYLPEVRQKLAIDVDDVRARNPRIVYARGSGLGPRGDERGKAGFDAISYWCRGGIARAVTPATEQRPIRMPAPAFGDVSAGLILAGGIAAALLHRERTGEASIVDHSLFGSALWAMQATVTGTGLNGERNIAWPTPYDSPKNPLVNLYQTSDGGEIAINLLQSERYWAGFCAAAGLETFVDDERFRTAQARTRHAQELVKILEDVFRARPMAEWTRRLASQAGPWDVVAWPNEVHDDPQAHANGYLQAIETRDGRVATVVVSPVQFDEQAAVTTPAPLLGEDTDQLLLELGLDWDAIMALKVDNVVT